MPDESADFQGATPSYPPTNLKVAVDQIAGVDYQRIKLDIGGDGVLVPLVAGRNADAASLPVAISTEDAGLLGSLTETAPATDTASSGLNGRLQRIAQRVTSLIALLPSSLGRNADAASFSTALSTEDVALIGALTETAPATDTASSGLNGRLQRIAQRLTSMIALLPSALVGGKFSVTTASTITPTWAATTTQILGPQMLAKGVVPLVGTVAVTSLKGGYLKVHIFRSGATAIDVAIQVRVRRLTGDTPPKYFDNWYAYTCGKTTAAAGVAAGSGNNAGVTSLTLNAAKTFAAGPNGDIQLGVIDNTTTPTTATEFLRQAFPTSTTVKVLEFPTQSAHNSTSHVVCDQAEALSIWLDGGESYSLSIDYSGATTGDSVYVDAYLNGYNSDGAS